MENEEWKCIVGFPDYEISSFGRIASRRQGCRKFLKPYPDSHCYLQVSLRKDGKTYHRQIHILVAIMFLPLPEKENMEINHKDLNKTNNLFTNLEWVTHNRNMIHAAEHEVYRKPWGGGKKGEAHGMHKLTEEQVLEIRALRGKMTQVAIAAKFGIHVNAVYFIQARKRWSHI